MHKRARNHRLLVLERENKSLWNRSVDQGKLYLKFGNNMYYKTPPTEYEPQGKREANGFKSVVYILQ